MTGKSFYCQVLITFTQYEYHPSFPQTGLMDGWSDKHSLTNISSQREREREREREDTRLSQQINAKENFLGDQHSQSSIKNQCSGDMLCFHDQHQHGE